MSWMSGLYPLHEWTFCGLGILVHSFFFKSLPLTLLLVAKSLGEYQYKFQGKNTGKKISILVQFIPFLRQVVQRKKKKLNQIPHVEEKLEPCFAKGSLVTLFKDVTMLFESFQNEWMFYLLFQIFIHCTIQSSNQQHFK